MKISAQLLIPLFFLLNSLSLFGQLNKEIKFNVIGPFKGEYRPSFELLLKKNQGFELEASFESQRRRLTNFFPSTNIPPPSFDYQNRRFEAAVSWKYYFSKIKEDYGFFGGIHTGVNFITKEDENYAANFEALFNTPPEDSRYKKGFNHFFYGLIAGYKFLIDEVVTCELSMRYVSVDYPNVTGIIDIDGTLFLKVGYRF